MALLRLFWALLGFCFALAQDETFGAPLQSPEALLVHPAVLPQQFNFDQPILASLGMKCQENFTCSPLPNTLCVDNSCQCMPSFMDDPQYPGTCRLAPGYNELCAPDEYCRDPFICNSTKMCDCPSGYIQEYFQCVPDCPLNQVPVVGKCYEGKQLGEECEVGEQCMQSYAQCLHGTCQCIQGANQVDRMCQPINQCPLGDPAKDSDGAEIQCKSEDSKNACPKDHYCIHAEFKDSNGYCCPKIKMNCPIGQPLEGKNCSECPWDTHHCFSYVIGSYTETMCCPNACPASQPILVDDQCYARSAYNGHCMIDEQCYNVVGASCRPDAQGEKRCQCPEGNYKNYFGKCLKESQLGEACERNEECMAGTSTVCLKGVCTCYQGYMPEPMDDPNQSPNKCIAEPSCPTASGVQVISGSYEDCSKDATVCNEEEEFCRQWWYDGVKSFSLCCKKPTKDDYEEICKPFGMQLMYGEGSEQLLNCDISPYPQDFQHAAGVLAQAAELEYCPPASSCIFDPFSINKGVCCQPITTEQTDNELLAGQETESTQPQAPIPVINLGS